MKIFVICPVRNADAKTKRAVAAYVKKLEKSGHEVYWPPRDTDQNDPVGLRICTTNREAILNAEAVHIWYDPQSQGSLFDLGMFFAFMRLFPEKRLVLINQNMVYPTDGKKGFNNVILALTKSAI